MRAARLAGRREAVVLRPLLLLAVDRRLLWAVRVRRPAVARERVLLPACGRLFRAALVLRVRLVVLLRVRGLREAVVLLLDCLVVVRRLLAALGRRVRDDVERRLLAADERVLRAAVARGFLVLLVVDLEAELVRLRGLEAVVLRAADERVLRDAEARVLRPADELVLRAAEERVLRAAVARGFLVLLLLFVALERRLLAALLLVVRDFGLAVRWLELRDLVVGRRRLVVRLAIVHSLLAKACG